MCTTPWCSGECESCIIDKELQEEYEDSITECPYRKECDFETINVKLDICRKCGYEQQY